MVLLCRLGVFYTECVWITQNISNVFKHFTFLSWNKSIHRVTTVAITEEGDKKQNKNKTHTKKVKEENKYTQFAKIKVFEKS